MFFLSVFFLSTFFSCSPKTVAVSATSKTETFKVWGNCGMCEKTIETACKTKGVSKADWSQDSHLLTITFDSQQISLDQIHQRIAKVGYDTDRVKGDDKAYSGLPACCQYERR